MSDDNDTYNNDTNNDTDSDIELPREAYFDNLLGNNNGSFDNNNESFDNNDNDYNRAITESMNDLELNDPDLELAIVNSIQDFETNQNYNNKILEKDIEKQIRTESLLKFIEQLKKFIAFEKSDLGQRILTIVEKYINCEIDNVSINSIDYENIFNFIKNIRINNDTRQLLNNIISKF